MSNKNPFEIRTDILEMAKDYMDKSWDMNVEITKKMVEAGNKNLVDLEEAMKPYSMESLMDKAQEMYDGFVTKKN